MFRFELRLTQECRTCLGAARGGFTAAPKELMADNESALPSGQGISLVGCVILGVCPSCSCCGMDDAAVASMLLRLDRPRAPMKFSQRAIKAARAALKTRGA